MSIFGFIWHYPATPGLILGLSSGTFQISAVMGFILHWIMNKFNVSFLTTLLIFAVPPFLSAWTLWFTLPSPATFRQYSEALARFRPLEYPSTPWRLLTDFFEVWKQKLVDNVCMLLVSASSFLFVASFVELLPLMLNTLLPFADGQEVLFIFYVAYAGIGVFINPVLGTIMDKLKEPVRFYIAMTFLLSADLVLFSIPYEVCQILCISGIVLFLSCWSLFIPKWFVLYAPPNLIGTATGIYITLSGIGILIFEVVLPSTPNLEDSQSTRFWLFLIFGSVSVAISVLFILTILGFKKKAPTLPPLPVGYKFNQQQQQQRQINNSGATGSYHTFHPKNNNIPEKWLSQRSIEPQQHQSKSKLTDIQNTSCSSVDTYVA